jgi:TatD DNase family protein
MEFFDTHAHYNDEKFNEDREEMIKLAYKENITRIVNVGYSVQGSKESIKIANEHDFIYATVGIHPGEITENFEEDIKQIEELAKNRKVVAIGEIGLDYYWNKENKEEQKSAFVKQIELANKMNLPIVIHNRDAMYDTLDIIKSTICNKKGILHCCPLNVDLVKQALNLGYYISFAGPITFKNSKNVEEVLEIIPMDKLLIETDSPYLSPEPFRGTRNNPINVKYIAERIASVKNLSIQEIAKITYENAKKIYNI